MESKLMGWRSKSLSWASRCPLLKTVAQAIPTYRLSTFDAPAKVCNNLDSLMKKFWWIPKKNYSRYLALKTWENLCQPKN